MARNSVLFSESTITKKDQSVKETKHSGKTVSTYTGSPDSVTIAGYARRFHYSEERKAEVLKKLKQ